MKIFWKLFIITGLLIFYSCGKKSDIRDKYNGVYNVAGSFHYFKEKYLSDWENDYNVKYALFIENTNYKPTLNAKIGTLELYGEYGSLIDSLIVLDFGEGKSGFDLSDYPKDVKYEFSYVTDSVMSESSRFGYNYNSSYNFKISGKHDDFEQGYEFIKIGSTKEDKDKFIQMLAEERQREQESKAAKQRYLTRMAKEKIGYTDDYGVPYTNENFDFKYTQRYLFTQTFSSDRSRLHFSQESNPPYYNGAVYMNGTFVGYIVQWYGERNDRGARNIPFKVFSPITHREHLFTFVPPDIVMEEDGKTYKSGYFEDFENRKRKWESEKPAREKELQEAIKELSSVKKVKVSIPILGKWEKQGDEMKTLTITKYKYGGYCVEFCDGTEKKMKKSYCGINESGGIILEKDYGGDIEIKEISNNIISLHNRSGWEGSVKRKFAGRYKRVGQNQNEEITANNEAITTKTNSEEGAIYPTKTEEKEKIVEQESENTQIFTHVDVPPSFPGGDAELMKWMQNNVKYPTLAQEQEVQGKVVLKFVINSNGSISNIEVIRSLETNCDQEAIRVIKSMPNWIPGRQNGRNVATYYTIPIMFRLR